MGILLAVVDFVILLFSSFVSSSLRFSFTGEQPEIYEMGQKLSLFGFNIDLGYTSIGVLTSLVWILAIWFYDGYKWGVVNGGSAWYKVTFNSGFVALAFLATLSYMIRVGYSRILFVLLIPVGIMFLLVWHFIFRRILRKIRRNSNVFTRKAMLIGSDSDIESMKETLMAHKNIIGYQIYGTEKFVDSEQFYKDLLYKIEQVKILDSVFVLGSLAGNTEAVRRIRWEIEDKDIELVVDSNLTAIAGERLEVSSLYNLPLIHVKLRQSDGIKFVIKRIFDIIVSFIALVISSPVSLICALIIKFQDGGPVFFRQERIGQNGRPFKMFKFRSMAVDAEERLAEVLKAQGQEVGVMYKLKDDPRITKIGKFLRKTSLDELPQFINVLVGDMSVVGPRPQIQEEVNQYTPEYRRRLLVKPGITGPWQVSGRNDLSYKESEKLDIEYVENWTLNGDVSIILKTVKTVLFPNGAY
jgi:exopolysaccharide biosynthesis polyprenyl glycosylphosphotransferase